MQALFYIGLFGTFFMIMSSITVGVSMSTMQQMVDQRAAVEKMFRDVDFAINRIILRENPSLSAYLQNQGLQADIQDVKFTAENLSWSRQQLENDPWDSDIIIKHIIEQQALGGDVLVDINYFILASKGVDRDMDATKESDLSAVSTSAEWRAFRSTYTGSDDDDDIIHTFSTRDALTEIWNQSFDAERQIIERAQRVYERNVDQFNVNNVNNVNILDNFTTCALFGFTDANSLEEIDCSPFEADLITECHQVNEGTPPATFNELPDGDVPIDECWRYDTNLQGMPDFPAMAGNMDIHNNALVANVASSSVEEALGIETHLENDPINSPASSQIGSMVFDETSDHPHLLIVNRRTADIPGWDLDGYQTVIKPE